MDQNPIKIFKLKYRDMLLENVVTQADESVHDLLKNHSIKDAIYIQKQPGMSCHELFCKKCGRKFSIGMKKNMKTKATYRYQSWQRHNQFTIK